jgi:hypothetical protein
MWRSVTEKVRWYVVSSRSNRVSALPLASGSRLGWFEKKNLALSLWAAVS